MKRRDGVRRSKRLPTRLQVTWVRGDSKLDLEATEIGLHGMFLHTQETITPSSLLQLVVRLPSRKLRMFVSARFVGVTDCGQGIGVEIFLMDELDRSFWREHYHLELQLHETRARAEAQRIAR